MRDRNYKPRIYFKLYPKLGRGFWCTAPRGTAWRDLPRVQQQRIEAAARYTQRLNALIVLNHDKTGVWGNGL